MKSKNGTWISRKRQLEFVFSQLTPSFLYRLQSISFLLSFYTQEPTTLCITITPKLIKFNLNLIIRYCITSGSSWKHESYMNPDSSLHNHSFSGSNISKYCYSNESHFCIINVSWSLHCQTSFEAVLHMQKMQKFVLITSTL